MKWISETEGLGLVGGTGQAWVKSGPGAVQSGTGEERAAVSPDKPEL